jgi:uncharacterized protein YoxC
MAQRQKDLINRLADAGEEAFSRVASSQATSRLVESIGGMRERLDDVQKKVRGIEALEQRVAQLERRLDELDKPKRASGTTRSRQGSSAKKATPSTKASGTSSASRSGTRKKPKPSSS